MIILAFLWQYIFKIFWIDKNPIGYFFDESENSIDAVYVGASNVYVHFNPTLAYNLYGYTTGILSTGSVPFAAMKYLIKESEKYQKPQLYIIDIYTIVTDFTSTRTEDIRRTTDSMNFSLNRINAINELLNYTDINKKEYINFYFSFLLYHNRWKNFDYKNINNTNLYKGYLFSNDTTKVEPHDKYNWTEDVKELEKNNIKALMDLIDYIKLNNLNVLFVVPIKPYEKSINEMLNHAISIIQENELDIINFNVLEDFEVDFSTDLWDKAHLNVYGATKFTLYFSKYLKEHYTLPDHRNDSAYNSWEMEYDRFKKDFKKLTNKNFDDLLLKYEKERTY